MNPNIYPSPSFTFFKMQPIFFHLYFHFFLPLDFFFFFEANPKHHIILTINTLFLYLKYIILYIGILLFCFFPSFHNIIITLKKSI